MGKLKIYKHILTIVKHEFYSCDLWKEGIKVQVRNGVCENYFKVTMDMNYIFNYMSNKNNIS